MKIEELFGTLQMSVVSGWRKHLRSAKYGKHIALQEFYEEMPDKVDALIEAWMGANGKKVGNFTNTLSSSNMNTLSYLKELKKVCKDGYDLLDDNEELVSLLDDIVNLINSTLYKVKELNESRVMSLTEFISEALMVNEGEIKSEKDFREYAKNKFEEVFGDELDEKKMNDTIDGLIEDNKDLVDAGEWGELVGMLNKSFTARINEVDEAVVTGENFYVTQVWSQGDSYDIGEPRMWRFETEEEAEAKLNEYFDGFSAAAFRQYYVNKKGFIAVVNDSRSMTTHFYEIRTPDELKQLYKSINRKKTIDFN